MNRADMLALLAHQITSLARPHPVRVAIDGIDASGKTCLADELVRPIKTLARPVIRTSIDNFHQPRAIRYRQGADSPAGYYQDSFDYQAVRAKLLTPLGPDGDRRYSTAAFDYLQDAPVDAPTHQATPDAILLFDGIFLLRPELVDAWDITIFVHVSSGIAIERACRRHQQQFGPDPSIRQRFEQRYLPGQQLYLASCQPLLQADILVDNNDLFAPSVIIRGQKR